MTTASPLAVLLAAPRAPLALLTAACLGALGTALASQYWGGLSPCEFCMWQRWVYVAALAVLLPGLATTRLRGVSLTLAGLVFLAGAALAAFHVGVEQHWWQGPTTCSSALKANLSLEDFEAQLLKSPMIRCDAIQWAFHGISMAGFNVAASLALAALALLARRRSGPAF